MRSEIEVEKELNRAGISKDQRNVLNTLGFVSLEYVESLRSVAHLFAPRRSRCGIYLLWFADGFSYIGQALDVVRRFGQHRADHSDIVAFGFQPVKRVLLDEAERKLIGEAEADGLSLRNVEHLSKVIGERDLDDVILPAEQEEWLKNRTGFNQAATSTPMRFPATFEQKARLRLPKFGSHPASSDCLSLLTSFALCCLPAPVRTEYTFWSVSCCPGTSANSWPRFACVSLSVMEVFVLGYYIDEPARIWGLLNISEQELLKRYSADRKFRARHPEIRLEKSNYRSAGHDQLCLIADDLGPLRLLLSDEAVLRASAVLNLRLMRQRATIYSRYHNPALARLIVNGQSKPVSDSRN
jgi:hypothetical protein